MTKRPKGICIIHSPKMLIPHFDTMAIVALLLGQSMQRPRHDLVNIKRHAG